VSLGGAWILWAQIYDSFAQEHRMSCRILDKFNYSFTLCLVWISHALFVILPVPPLNSDVHLILSSRTYASMPGHYLIMKIE